MEQIILEVENLCKEYSHFMLDNVSFSLRPGTITGFIGRNGAGKSTTLKSLLNLVHPDRGMVRFFGGEFDKNEFAVKQKIGFVSGGVSFYPRKKLRDITAVERRFYSDWDESAYRHYMEEFQLLEDKTPSQLSEGMKVKYSLTLALSHHAELLILDEPTSGLDPVSREDLLEVFLRLARQGGTTILFSTHITSDLDKCADDIIYIRAGKIIHSGSLDAFVSGYRLVTCHEKPEGVIGPRESRDGWTAIIHRDDPTPAGARASDADLESIMVHLEKEG